MMNLVSNINKYLLQKFSVSARRWLVELLRERGRSSICFAMPNLRRSTRVQRSAAAAERKPGSRRKVTEVPKVVGESGRKEEVLEGRTVQLSVSKVREEARVIVACIDEEIAGIKKLLSQKEMAEGAPSTSGPSIKNIRTEEDGTFGCPLCRSSFERLKKLREHRSAHVNSSVLMECAVCQAGFSGAVALRKHLEAGHESSHVFNCSKCGTSFATPDEISIHVKTTHTEGDESILCNICGVDFQTFDQYMFHMNTHQKQRGRPRSKDAVKFSDDLEGGDSEKELKMGTVRQRKCRIKRRKLRLELEYQLHIATHRQLELEGEFVRLKGRIKLWRQWLITNGLAEEAPLELIVLPLPV